MAWRGSPAPGRSRGTGGGALLGHGFFHSLHNGGHQGAGDIANGQLDDPGLGVRGGIGRDTAGHLGKEVAAGHLQKVFVYLCHIDRAL